MKLSNLRYICNIAAQLTGVPIRAFDGQDQLFSCALPHFEQDPLELNREEIWDIDDNIGYYTSARFFYYGVVRQGNLRIIMGPTRQVPVSDQDLRQIALFTNVSSGKFDDFAKAVRSISPLPLHGLLQVLCCINFALNGETLELQDIAIFESDQEQLKSTWAQNALDQARETSQQESPAVLERTGLAGSGAYALERMLMRMVRNGDIAALSDWLAQAPAVHGGTLAAEEIRQLKNTFVVSTTLVSRAAIDGGMIPEDVFALSDGFIQSCERLKTPEQINNLQYHMITDFTERVARIRFGLSPTPLTIAVGNYVQHHLSEAIKVEDIAQHLFMSRSHLSTRFKKETGESISRYIMRRKIEEAKHLLRYTDRSAAEIGSYLGFSSQGHFSRSFHSVCEVSPSEYRKTNSRARS